MRCTDTRQRATVAVEYDIHEHRLHLHLIDGHQRRTPTPVPGRPGVFTATMCCADRKSPVPFEAPMRCTAPEVEAARESGAAGVVTDGSADMWALGVLAFELLTQSSAFPPGVPVATVRKMVLGRIPLPWEEQGISSEFAEDVQVCVPLVSPTFSAHD